MRFIKKGVSLVLALLAITSTANAATPVKHTAGVPDSLVTADYVESSAGDEPYLIKCNPHATRIILFLHTWSGDYQQVKTAFPELAAVESACIISPNFNGPNTTAQALGSDDTLIRIDAVVKDAQSKTGLKRLDISAVSGGTMEALSYMGKYPGKVHAASIWLVIYDLASIYNTTQDQQLKDNMLAILGAAPTGPDDPVYLERSPRARLSTIKGPTKLTMNVGTMDTSTPGLQALLAKDHITSVAKDVSVTIKTWPITHEFSAPVRQEALKQLTLE
jgi:hypothetical protein